jgi:deoxyribonuclease V
MEEGEIASRYGLNIEKLKEDQIKLAKTIELKDKLDFDSIERIGAIDTIIVQNKIIAVAIVCDKEFNVIEEQYFMDTLRFPYLFEFRSYREMRSIIEAFNKLNEKPDVVFLKAHGVTHPRLGLASHFAIFTGIPSIGVADFLFDCDKVEDEDIIKDGKKVGKVLMSKEGSKPIYVSAGSFISLASSLKLCKEFIREPHKLPEPLHLAHKYVKSVKAEMKI